MHIYFFHFFIFTDLFYTIEMGRVFMSRYYAYVEFKLVIEMHLYTWMNKYTVVEIDLKAVV